MADTIDYRAVLADLKAKRAALDQTIAGIELILGESASGDSVLSNNGARLGEIQADTFVGLNIPDATAKFLRMVGRPARTTEAITEALGRGGLDVNQSSVATVLGRDHNRGEGEVVRVGRGLWGLADWYPKRPGRATRREPFSGEEGNGETGKAPTAKS